MKVIPTLPDAETLAREIERPCLIPFGVTEEELESPAEVYLTLREKYDSSYLLESIKGPSQETRYSVVGCQPLLHLKIKDGEVGINGDPALVEASQERVEEVKDGGDALDVLREALFFDEIKLLGLNLPRYVLGATGYLGYDFIRSRVDLCSNSRDDLEHPILEFMLPELVRVFDHRKELTYYASLMLLTPETDFEDAHARVLRELEDFIDISSEAPPKEERDISTSSNIEKENFEKSVEKIKEYIRAGDMIQTVFSRRIDLDPIPSLGKFYSELRRVNPSPYMFFLDFPERSVIGSSPEVLVRVQDDEVLTRPIAGTRRRGEDQEDDLKMERDLLEDEKERAEHVMLVDLGRNDIGKVSEFGSVEVPEFMEIEKYGDVQHIVSTVTGELRDDKDAFDALRAVFPAGTVTGAPKVRAMEIIEELEPTRRGIYSGAVGTFSYTGDADFAIAIRTLTAGSESAQVQVGAGIVADSKPELEFYETENKARSLLRAAGVMDESSSDR